MGVPAVALVQDRFERAGRGVRAPEGATERLVFRGSNAGAKKGKPWMWSQCVWLKRMLALTGATGGAMSASPSGRAPVPQSKMKMCPSAVRTSTHEVLPPKRTVCEPGVGIDPRVPQNP